MLKAKYQYPGDPIEDVEFMFGQEFLDASDQPREIVIRSFSFDDEDEERIPVEGIICDSCNAGVGEYEPCALALSRLYCWNCYEEWIKPHLIVA